MGFMDKIKDMAQQPQEGAAMPSSYTPGTRWQAKADPNDRTRLLLYGQT